MLRFKDLLALVLISIFFFEFSTCAVLEKFFNEASTCENSCAKRFSGSSDKLKACSEGCRLFTVIDLAKSLRDYNKTVELCKLTCTEAFINETNAEACSHGCVSYPAPTVKQEDEVQTLHLIRPLMHVRSAFHHMRHLVLSNWMVYVQEDDGRLLVVQSNPQLIQTPPESDRSVRVDTEVEDRSSSFDWVDCFSTSSGIPRWILLCTLLVFILFLLWLCCSTAITAPIHHIHTSKKDELSYILLQNNTKDMKFPISSFVDVKFEAPPLPDKASLIP